MKDLFELYLVENSRTIIKNNYDYFKKYKSRNYDFIFNKFCNYLDNDFLNNNSNLNFELYMKNYFIGCLELIPNYNQNEFEFEYLIENNFRGNSIMPKFLDNVIELVNYKLKPKIIWGRILKENINSQKVILKSKFDFKKENLPKSDFDLYILNLR